jgi:ribosome recycling factor
LVKVLKDKLEESRITIRHERVTVLEDIEAKKKEVKMTEDEMFRAKEELQKITNEINASLGDIFEKKEKEVMG